MLVLVVLLGNFFFFILHFSDPEDKGGEAAFSKAPLFFVETAFKHNAHRMGRLILGVIWRCCFRQLLRCGKLCQMQQLFIYLYLQSVVQNDNRNFKTIEVLRCGVGLTFLLEIVTLAKGRSCQHGEG